MALIINPSEDACALAGKTFYLRFTVTNQGQKGDLIKINIEKSYGLLRQWCASPFESLALAKDSSAEVVFRFAIPITVNPAIYSYLLVIDAPKHYPEDTAICHEAPLQVLPPVQSAVRVNDPTFTILPATSTTQPAIVKPGQALDLKAIVHNRSDRVDHFRLTSSDLTPDWFTIIYPEGLVELELVAERESLALNRGAKGEIQLRLLFPLNMKAGNYSFTVLFTSLNNLDLVLMDVVCLQVLPTYRLTTELQTKIGKVGQESGWFRLLLFNSGNTLRDLTVMARENADTPLCTYTYTPQSIKLETQAKSHIDLRVKPNKWWLRPWFNNGLPI